MSSIFAKNLSNRAPKRAPNRDSEDDLAKLEKIKEMEEQLEIREGLPHLYGWDWYEWAWEFFTSRNKVRLLTAGNQLSKSSTQIRGIINWATDEKLQRELWSRKPNLFWYLYPTKDTGTVEFYTKWVPEYLPRGKYQKHSQYGWEAEFDLQKKIYAIHFLSGVSIYFKSYSQDVSSLQAGSVYYVACDEELPAYLYDEVKFRLAATDGYFSMVFTATLGQEFWRLAMEPKEYEKEKFPNAWKRQVSAYDCLFYRNRKPSPWTIQRIERLVSECKSEAEVKKRVEGKFTKAEDMLFHAYIEGTHLTAEMDIPFAGNYVGVGVDIGSGSQSKTSHPAAIVFIIVDKSFTRGIIFKSWRGDDVATTSGDIFDKYIDMKGSMSPLFRVYDYASGEFGIIAQRGNEYFSRAIKSIDKGLETVNTLFSYNALKIYKEDIGNQKLSVELSSLTKKDIDTPGGNKDDLASALRYLIMEIPWDWDKILGTKKDGMVVIAPKDVNKNVETTKKVIQSGQDRLDYYNGTDRSIGDAIELEFEYWNSLSE